MGSNYTKYNVADLIERDAIYIGDGYRAKNSELSDTGIPFIRVGNLLDTGFDFDSADLFPEQDLHKVGNKMSEARDIALTTKGTVGRIAYVDGNTRQFVYSPQLSFWRVLDDSVIHPRYLYYWIQGHEFKAQAYGLKGQTDMADFISLRDQRSMYLTLPELDEQTSIAEFLSSFDDKIELNQQMNQTLEEMARAIFKSWFVDFDPVHENVQAAAAGRPVPHPDFPAAFVDSALGPVPEGWRVGTLDNAAEIHDSKRIPLSKREREQRQGKYPYYGAASLMDYVDDYIFDGVHLLVAEDGSVIDDKNRPVLQYVWGQFWVNNHAHVLTGKNTCSTEQLMLAMKFINIKPYITGAVQLKINQANLKRIPFILPSAELNTKFKETVQFFYERIRTNTEESQTLAELRDTLLPQLISGHLRLPEIKETG